MPRFLVLSVFCVTLASCALPMGIRHNAFVKGNSITYVYGGTQPPTVVFESGLGNGLESWGEVFDEVQAFASVFAYSRPGYSPGLNAIGTGATRTARDSSNLLASLLEKTNVQAPIVLVGHSIGGLYAMEFARDHPDLVKGLVIVDGRLPGFTEACQAAGISPCLPPATATALAPRHIAAEVRGIRESEASAPSPGQLRMPVILLAATIPPSGAPADAQPIWLRVQKDFANALPDGRFIVAQGSGHYIQKDMPDLVVSAIREMVLQNR